MKLKGKFNVKEKLFGESIISKPCVIWIYDKYEVEVHDREKLLQIRATLAEEGDYAGAKIANEIILELDFYEKKACLDAFPVSFQVEHSSYCNARCIMCSHALTGNCSALNLRKENMLELEKFLPYVREIVMHGVGEPFLHPKITEILDKYKEYGVSMSGNTNGAVMSEALAEKISENFTNLSISCDAAMKETYEKIRRGLSFDTFIQNVRLLRRTAPHNHLRMAVVAMRQNLKEMPDIVKMASELEFNDVFISDVTTQSLLENEEDDITLYPEVTSYYMDQAMQAGKNYGIPVFVPETLNKISKEHVVCNLQLLTNHDYSFKEETFYLKLEEQYKKLGSVPTYIEAKFENFVQRSSYRCEGICDYILERSFIDAEGNVFLCCIDWLHCLGNLKESSFAGIWNNALLQAIREMFYSGWIPKYCVGCIFLRNQIMCKRIKVLNMDDNFHQHNFNETVRQIMNFSACEDKI